MAMDHAVENPGIRPGNDEAWRRVWKDSSQATASMFRHAGPAPSHWRTPKKIHTIFSSCCMQHRSRKPNKVTASERPHEVKKMNFSARNSSNFARREWTDHGAIEDRHN
jgi:hypothetical protein